MNRNLLFALSLLGLALASVMLSGCSDETKADPAIVESMNQQRQAMSPENQGKAAPQAAPGTTK